MAELAGKSARTNLRRVACAPATTEIGRLDEVAAARNMTRQPGPTASAAGGVISRARMAQTCASMAWSTACSASGGGLWVAKARIAGGWLSGREHSYKRSRRKTDSRYGQSTPAV